MMFREGAVTVDTNIG